MLKKKPTLLHIRQQTTLKAADIAQAAGVSIGEEYAVEIGGFASPAVVDKVLTAFNRLSGLHLSIHDIASNASNHTIVKREI